MGSLVSRLHTSVVGWLTRRWIWIVAVVAGTWVVLLGLLAWRFAGRPVKGTEGLIAQLDILVGVSQVGLALMVALATIHHARVASQMFESLRQREADDRRRERIGIVHAYVGSAIEATGYLGAIAQIQRRGLRTWRRWFPESEATRRFLLSGWEQLADSVAHVSKGLERLRYSEPDLVPSAELLFDVVLDLQRKALDGRIDELQEKAARVRQIAPDLRDAAIEPNTT